MYGSTLFFHTPYRAQERGDKARVMTLLNLMEVISEKKRQSPGKMHCARRSSSVLRIATLERIERKAAETICS